MCDITMKKAQKFTRLCFKKASSFLLKNLKALNIKNEKRGKKVFDLRMSTSEREREKVFYLSKEEKK
jgi:hypothetical protein